MADSTDEPKSDVVQTIQDSTLTEPVLPTEEIDLTNAENHFVLHDTDALDKELLDQEVHDQEVQEQEEKSPEAETEHKTEPVEEESKMDCDDATVPDDVLDLTAGGYDDHCMEEDESKEDHEGDGEHEEHEMQEDEEEEEEEEEEEPDDAHIHSNQDPNVMPQVNVAILAQRKWQVKVYPLKPADFVSGQISRVFKNARESLLYLLSPGKNARGKGEMYISSVNQTVTCVHSLMRLEYSYPEINVEIIKKNDEGAIEEKAYLRFDSSLTRILTMKPARRSTPGRKRDRLIGSVFVKNLPPGTTKDTLRVMFPFAQEINYNPEKFKDCTARLVLHYRSHVIPCLKAFAKVELGGNVLELHPLTKRKRDDSENEDMPTVKQSRKSNESKEDSENKDNETKKAGPKQSVKKEETLKKDSKQKVVPRLKDNNTKDKNKPQSKKPVRPANRINNQRKDQRYDNKPYRPRVVGSGERFSSTRGSQASKFSRGGRGRQDRPLNSSSRSFRDNQRDNNTSARRLPNNRNSRIRGSVNSPRSRQNSMGGGSSYGVGSSIAMGSAVSASDANLAINAEATKEMVLLQNQLSMAIKNQLAMLNQTQLAVEQAKRGASSIGLGSASDVQSSLPRASPKGQRQNLGRGTSGSTSNRRSVDQYRPASSLNNSYDGGYGNRSQPRSNKKRQNNNPNSGRGGRGHSTRGQGSRGRGATTSTSGNYNKRGAARGGYASRNSDPYRDDREEWDYQSTSQAQDAYSYPQDYMYDREFGGFGSSTRSSYTQGSSYSGYY